jgi:hypothetical protein
MNKSCYRSSSWETLHISTYTYIISQQQIFPCFLKYPDGGGGVTNIFIFESVQVWGFHFRGIGLASNEIFHCTKVTLHCPQWLPKILGLDSTASNCLQCHHHSKKNPRIVSSAPGCTHVSPQLFGSLPIQGSLHCSRSRMPLHR